ncbi:ABC transporter ATP-binding protein [Streptomyces roseolus]|uniref:ABC transporter ATP-binding protein n=2 Tax=Streptomyces roseolus TaxID=67358 RepID=UPI0036551A7D
MRSTERGARTSPVLALLRAAIGTDARRTVTLAAAVAASGALPILIAIANGHLVGLIRQGDQGVGIGQAVSVTAVALAAMFFCLQLTALVINIMAEDLGRRIGDSLRQRMMAAMLRPATVAPLEDRELLDRVAVARGIGTNQVEVHVAVTALANLSVTRLQALACGVVLLWFDPLLGALVTLAYFALTLALAAEYRDQQGAVYTESERLRRSGYIRDLALTGEAAKEIRVFGLADWLERQFASAWRPGVAGARLSPAVLRILAACAAVVAAHTVLFYRLTTAAADGSLGFGGFIAFTTAASGLVSVIALTMDLVYLREGALAIPAALSVIAELDGHAPAADGERVAAPLPPIVFENVGFRYPGSSRWALRGLDLEIRPGETLAVVGFNGAGKTTLVKLLCGLQRPTEGRITVGGRDLATLEPAAWQRHFAVVFQQFNRYPVSFAENIAFGAPQQPADRERIEESARAAGAETLARRLPHGFDTVLSRRYPDGDDLSGGQWQRVAVARALHAVRAGAPCLVLDEPTSALDARAEARFYDEVMERSGASMTLLISHRFATVRHADRIITLDGGRITEDGSHDELMRQEGVYAQMFTLQAKRFHVD